MIPNVTRGERMGGLLSYLVGPGKRNEHTDPHLVAGDPAMLAWYDDHELSGVDASAMARHLDRPRTAFGVQVPGGHVWHCSLSIRADEGELSDQVWGRIAGEFLGKMGLDDQQGSKAPLRWVAVRHGVSAGGNDHVHVVVNLVREDGTKASIHNDYKKAQQACRELEAEHGLARLGSPELAGRGVRAGEVEAATRRAAQAAYEAEHGGSWAGLSAAERDRLVAAARPAEAPRVRLARIVRGCSTAAADEAEFVRRLRRAGVLVRPRLASGRDDVVTGYSVALRAPEGASPVWYGGGRLDRDLTLPRLRAEWPDTPQSAAEAAAEWAAARRGQRPVNPGRETAEADPALWQQAARELAALREQLRAVPAGDVHAWSRVARQTSGAYAAWSMRTEPTPGPLAAGAAALARCAQTRTAAPARPAPGPSVAGSAMLLAAAAAADDRMAQALVLRQLLNLSKAVYDAAKASGDARRAQAIETAVRQELVQVAASLPTPGAPEGAEAAVAAVATARAAQAHPAAGMGSPVPNRLQPDRPRTPITAPGTGRGVDQGLDGR